MDETRDFLDPVDAGTGAGSSVEARKNRSVLKQANLAVRFVELCALAALVYWGFSVDANAIVRILLGTGAPLAAAFAWGAYVAPRAQVRAPGSVRLAVELAVLGLGVAALAVTGPAALAWAFAALVVVNTVLTTIWRQRWYA